MKHFWALPAFLRFVVANQQHFSVFDDLLAYPQYEVLYADAVVSEEFAEKALSASRRSAVGTVEPHPSPDTSLHRAHEKYSNLEPELRLDDAILGYENMVLGGQRYLCSIPRVPDEETTKNASKPNAEEEEKELARATTRGWELLKAMEGTCLYFFSGWWSYSFCYGHGVRQFHQLPPGKNVPIYPPVEDKGVQAYVLGRFEGDAKSEEEGEMRKTLDAEKNGAQKPLKEEGRGTMDGKEMREKGLARLETKGEMRYLVQKLKGGTTCDLTGKERRIEVQFHCQENMADRISLIKETSTCQYLMVISTMRLCHDVAFLPPKASKPHAIACTPVLPESGITSYLADKESQAESDDAAMDAALDDEIIKAVNQLESGQVKKKKQVVGDIEIGAHAVVPLGKKVEKSAVVGGGKETLVATIAKSDGFIASDKEMQRVGIRSNKEIEGVKKEVERVAQGKGWRLDVVQTPRGKELRGIIDDDDDDKKEIKKTTKEAEGLVSPDDAQEEGAPQPTSGSEEDQEGSEETYKEEL